MSSATWQPIETAPKGKIMRWHKTYKCPITVQRNRGLREALEWITGCYTNSWPEEAFTPHWAPLPPAPQAKLKEKRR